MKVAIIADWLSELGGAERVIKAINDIYPQADIFAIVDFLPKNLRDIVLSNPDKKTVTTFLQSLPFGSKFFKKLLIFMPFAIEQLDLAKYDIVISSSHSVAKGILSHSEQLHFCYCHSPMRYAWDLYFDYQNSMNFFSALISKFVLHRVRNWDVLSANRVDYFASNSYFVASRVRKIYRREAEVIYPPIEFDKFPRFFSDRDDYFISVSRLVEYKKIEEIAKAFIGRSERLVIIGAGPLENQIKKIASKNGNIEYLAFCEESLVRKKIAKSRAFIFAAKDDFGIAPVEAMACGVPVIAYAAGGALETVIEGENGIFFNVQDAKSISDAIDRFKSYDFNSEHISALAKKFDVSFFRDHFKNWIESKIK